MKNKEIANTIMMQIGGNKFAVMTGIKIYLIVDNGVQMKLTRNNMGAQWLRITLAANDTYTMEFIKFKKMEVVENRKFDGVYNDMLQGIFTNVTGLNTQL